MTDITELAKAAEKYRLTLKAHRQNPKNYDVMDAWDAATNEFMALVNNDELNIIAYLLDKIETEEGNRKGAFIACNRWYDKFREAEGKLETVEQRNAELVEALEKAQQVDEELCKLLPPGAEYMDPPDGGDVTPLEGVRRMVADYRQRIAELREWNAGLAQESFERQQRISELEPIRAAAEKLVRCKGRYHSEQNYRALAALFGVSTPDLPPLEKAQSIIIGLESQLKAAENNEIDARCHIAELEESNAQVIYSRDHYKRMTEEGLRKLAESRTVTVKLPPTIWYEHDDYAQEIAVLEKSRVLQALTAAGIKWEAE